MRICGKTANFRSLRQAGCLYKISKSTRRRTLQRVSKTITMSNTEFISRSVDYPNSLSVHDLLEIQGNRRADAIAIGGLGNPPLSFRRLLLQVEQTAKTLNALGVGRNDRVAMVTPNGPEMASAFFSVSSAATFAPLNPACRTNEFDFYLTDLGAKALIVQSSADSPPSRSRKNSPLPSSNCLQWQKPPRAFFLSEPKSGHPYPKAVLLKQTMSR